MMSKFDTFDDEFGSPYPTSRASQRRQWRREVEELLEEEEDQIPDMFEIEDMFGVL